MFHSVKSLLFGSKKGKKSKWLYENITIIVVLTTSSIIVLFSILFFVRESFVSSPKPSN